MCRCNSGWHCSVWSLSGWEGFGLSPFISILTTMEIQLIHSNIIAWKFLLFIHSKAHLKLSPFIQSSTQRKFSSFIQSSFYANFWLFVHSKSQWKFSSLIQSSSQWQLSSFIQSSSHWQLSSFIQSSSQWQLGSFIQSLSQWQLQLIHAITMATAAHSCNHYHNGNCSSFMQSSSCCIFFQFDVQQHIFLIECTLENILFTVQAKDQWCEWKRESEFVDTENIIPFI